MKSFKLIGASVGLVALLLVYASFYCVHEGQRAVLTSWRSAKTAQLRSTLISSGPGLHFKWPWLTHVTKFDTRLQIVDIKNVPIVSSERTPLLVDYYLTWRIADPALYLLRTSGSARQVSLQMEEQLNDYLRAQLSTRAMSTLLAAERVSLSNDLQKTANNNVQALGIQIIDAQIERINFADTLLSTVLERMRAAQQRLAVAYADAGKQHAENIRADATNAAELIIADAENQAAQLRGIGDAQAAKIYADAYGQDAAFYQFYRSLAAYKKVFAAGQNTVFVLKPDSAFFKYFNNENGAGSHK